MPGTGNVEDDARLPGDGTETPGEPQARAGAPAVAVQDADVTIDPDIADAMEGHARFRAQFAADRDFFQGLATAKQRPRLLWIGCSDSRVVPAQITSADPGELFEIRNIANSVPPAYGFDDSVGAAIAYALDHLHVDDIVVCGHTGCGGIAALLDAPDVEGDLALARWLDLTRPAHAQVRAAGVTGGARHDAVARAHVQFQLANLMTYPSVAKGVAEGRVGVHGWLYDMHEGRLVAFDTREALWRDILETGGAGTSFRRQSDTAT